jgi:integrase
MPRNLTPQFIKAMEPPASGNRVEWDTQERGLGVRITAGGYRAFVLRYVAQGRERRMTLGDYPTLTLMAAREIARSRKGEVVKGADPLRAKEAQRTALTLGRAVERYVAERVPEQKARTRIETRRALEKQWEPLHPLPLAGITRGQVAARLSEIAKASGPVAANRARAQLSALFRWAISEGMAEANPVAGTNKREEKPRERTLSPDELRAIWQACGDDDHGRIVRLLLLTGQRREEVAGMAWGELNLERALWTLPGARTKNGKPHEVPLADAALAVLEAVQRRPGRDLLFGEGEGPFSGWSRCKARLDDRVAAARAKADGRDKPAKEGTPAPWVLHDLRRTAVTGMAGLGIQPHVIEAVVNHISGHKAGVAGIYNRATYAAEKRQALQRWADHVMALAAGEPSKVVSLSRARA